MMRLEVRDVDLSELRWQRPAGFRRLQYVWWHREDLMAGEEVPCYTCNGSGQDHTGEECNTCAGTGWVTR